MHVEGDFDAAAVRAALDWLQAGHALLQVVVGERPEYFLGPAGPLPLRVVERRDDATWFAEEERALNAPFMDGAPLVELTWVRGQGRHELMISHHHVIADAQSAARMSRELFIALGQAASDVALPARDMQPMSQSFEKLLAPAAPLWRRFGFMNQFFFRHVLGDPLRGAQKLALEEYAKPSARQLAVCHAQLDATIMQRVREKCRAEKTTLHGAIGAALLRAIAETMPTRGLLGFFSGIGMRQHLAEPHRDELGLYVSQVTTFHADPLAHKFWPLARDVKARLSRELTRGQQFVTLPMLGMFVPRDVRATDDMVARFDLASPAAIGATNIGVIDIPRAAGALRLVDYQTSVGPSLVAPAIVTVTTLGAVTNFNLVLAMPLWSVARGQTLLTRALELLQESA